jgi:hypothetical protein
VTCTGVSPKVSQAVHLRRREAFVADGSGSRGRK